MLIKSYPVYVIRLGSGYVTMAKPDSPEDKQEFAVLVFTTEKLAEDFITAVNIEDAEVRFLRNERELGRVLVAQPEGVTHIAIDTVLNDGHLETNCLTLYDMIKNHMKLARSPWDYPVFFLCRSDGSYAAIMTGNAKEEASKNSLVLAMFTSNQKAKVYRSRLNHPSQYELRRIETPTQLLEFFQDLPKDISVVAFNPIVDENGTHNAVQCMEITKVIEKFLV